METKPVKVSLTQAWSALHFEIPNLNLKLLSNSAAQICNLALADSWPEFLSSYNLDRVGLYLHCFDNYSVAEYSYKNWQPQRINELSSFLRKYVPPRSSLKKNAGMNTGALSIALKIRGPTYSLSSDAALLRAFELASLDLNDSRIDLALFGVTLTDENFLETSGINAQVFCLFATGDLKCIGQMSAGLENLNRPTFFDLQRTLS